LPASTARPHAAAGAGEILQRFKLLR
jgi:hypothetical protein